MLHATPLPAKQNTTLARSNMVPKFRHRTSFSVVGILFRLRQAQWERCNAEVVQAVCLVDLSIGLHRVTVLVE